MICPRCLKKTSGVHTCTSTPLVRELEEKLAAVSTERDALKKDAERYRWLRTHDDWDCGIVLLGYNDYTVAQEAELDAAIDAAKQGIK